MTWSQRIAVGLLLLAHVALMWWMPAWIASDSSIRGFDEDVAIGAAYGVLMGQWILGSLWLVCLHESRWWRGLSVFLAAGAMWLAMVLAFTHMGDASLSPDASLPIEGGVLIAASILANSSLLAATWPLSRWRISLPGNDRQQVEQVSLRRIMLGILAVCLFLAVARKTLATSNEALTFDFVNVEQHLVNAVSAAVIHAMNLALMSPMIAVLFKRNRNALDEGLVAVCVPVYGLAMTMVEVVLLSVVTYDAVGHIWFLLPLNTTQLLTVVGTLIVLRGSGIRLEQAPPTKRWRLFKNARRNRRMADPRVWPSTPDDNS